MIREVFRANREAIFEEKSLLDLYLVSRILRPEKITAKKVILITRNIGSKQTMLKMMLEIFQQPHMVLLAQ